MAFMATDREEDEGTLGGEAKMVLRNAKYMVRRDGFGNARCVDKMGARQSFFYEPAVPLASILRQAEETLLVTMPGFQSTPGFSSLGFS